MATPAKQLHPSKRPRKTPALTRNGRVRYKGLSIKQLTELIMKTTIKKLKAKYMRHIERKSQLFAKIPNPKPKFRGPRPIEIFTIPKEKHIHSMNVNNG